MYANTRPNLKTSPTDVWLRGHVAGVIVYSKTHPKFASSLAHHVQARTWKQVPIDKELLQVSAHLVPCNQDNAIAIATWLLQSLDTRPDALSARSMLTNWAQNFESPKDLVFGIVGMAIIGPTLGIINKKKKRRSHLQIVIDEKYYSSLSKTQIINLTQKLSMEILAKELSLVGGNSFNLHPDTAEWFLEDATIKLFADTSSNISELAAAAKTENLNHSSILNEESIITSLALSPSVNDSFVNESEAEIIS